MDEHFHHLLCAAPAAWGAPLRRSQYPVNLFDGESADRLDRRGAEFAGDDRHDALMGELPDDGKMLNPPQDRHVLPDRARPHSVLYERAMPFLDRPEIERRHLVLAERRNNPFFDDGAGVVVVAPADLALTAPDFEVPQILHGHMLHRGRAFRCVRTLVDFVIDLAPVGIGLFFQLECLAAPYPFAIDVADNPRRLFDAVVSPLAFGDTRHYLFPPLQAKKGARRLDRVGALVPVTQGKPRAEMLRRPAMATRMMRDSAQHPTNSSWAITPPSVTASVRPIRSR